LHLVFLPIDFFLSAEKFGVEVKTFNDQNPRHPSHQVQKHPREFKDEIQNTGLVRVRIGD
jgi:hypothetical protein